MPTSAARLRPHLRRDCAHICVKQHELRTERCKPAGGPPRVPPECSAHRKQRHESIGAALNDGLHLRTSAPCGAWESNAHSSARYASACVCAHSRDRVTRAHKPREHAHAPVVRRCAGRASGGPKARVHAYAHACGACMPARAHACACVCVLGRRCLPCWPRREHSPSGLRREHAPQITRLGSDGADART